MSDDKMHLPGAILDVPSISEADAMLINDFALKRGLDIVAASLTRKPEDIEDIRKVLTEKEAGKKMQIYAKIQSLEGLRNYEEILQVADGIMIDRQSMAMELPPDKAIIAQKWMIMKANVACKPVIAYMQVLDSMTVIPDPNIPALNEMLSEEAVVPTRLEAQDIAGTITDGIDALMLWRETSEGKYGLYCTKQLARICAEAE
jgi:pyruvate kinase